MNNKSMALQTLKAEIKVPILLNIPKFLLKGVFNKPQRPNNETGLFRYVELFIRSNLSSANKSPLMQFNAAKFTLRMFVK